MDVKFRDKIIAKLEGSIRWAGASSFDEGMSQAAKVLTFFLERIEQMKTRDDMERLLDSMPQPNYAEGKMILGVLSFLPQILRAGARKLANQLEGDVSAPAGGRPPIPQQTRAEIVVCMGDLHTPGTSLSACKKRAAARFGYSKSTIERAWLSRSEVNESDFRSAWNWLVDSAKQQNT
jgi:hypothetical protein